MTVVPARGWSFSAASYDVARGGLYVVSDDKPPVGTRCTVCVDPRESKHLAGLMLTGTVVRAERTGFAMALDMGDRDAADHLLWALGHDPDDTAQAEAA